MQIKARLSQLICVFLSFLSFPSLCLSLPIPSSPLLPPLLPFPFSSFSLSLVPSFFLSLSLSLIPFFSSSFSLFRPPLPSSSFYFLLFWSLGGIREARLVTHSPPSLTECVDYHHGDIEFGDILIFKVTMVLSHNRLVVRRIK